MAWMLQGKKNPDFLGAKGCKTDLKSEIEVIGIDGKAEPAEHDPKAVEAVTSPSSVHPDTVLAVADV